MLKEKSSPAKAISMIATQAVMQAAEGVDGAAGEVDAAAVAVAPGKGEGGGGDGGEEGERQQRAAEARHRSWS